METKQQIRKAHLRRRDEISRKEAAEASKKASGQLCRYFCGREAELKTRGVYGYYPHGTELSLLSLYEWLLGMGVPLAFPRVLGTEMEFYRVFSMKEFAEGSFGIMEPIFGCVQAEKENAFCLVPGSVFDRRGNRYGYGKGYYDRYFARHLGLYRMGAAYESQVEEKIPSDCFDVKMQMLVTENGVLFF